MKQFKFFNIRLIKKRDMKPKKILFLIASLGLLAANSKPIYAEEVLISHARIKKIVNVRYKPIETKKVVRTEVLPNGRIKKIIVTSKLCKRTRAVRAMDGTLLRKKVTLNVECPKNISLYNQKRIFSNHKSSVTSSNHTHYHSHTPKVSNSNTPAPKVVDDNSCKEGSIIGGLLGAGITMSATRGKDRWWAVPAGGTAGALIGCQIDGG